MKRSSTLLLGLCVLTLTAGLLWLGSYLTTGRTRLEPLAVASRTPASPSTHSPASPAAAVPATSSPPAVPPPSASQTLATAAGVTPSDQAAASDNAADEGLVTATAALRRQSGETLPLKSVEGLFKQVLLDPVETVQVSLDLEHFDQTKPVRLVANNGGSINRRVGPTVIDPATSGPRAEFTFGVGATRGAYTVEVLQGTRTELFDFWVGPLPPRGDPGPARESNSDAKP